MKEYREKNEKNLNLENQVIMEFDAISENESLARVVVASVLTRFNPTLDEIEDIKTAVSEAVTNAIVHGYGKKYIELFHDETIKKVRLEIKTDNDANLFIDVCDEGIGINDIEKAMQPSFTTDAEGERSGMGFAFMEAFMDEVKVESIPMHGTTVHMSKKLSYNKNLIEALKSNEIHDDMPNINISKINTSLQFALWNSEEEI